MFKVSISWNFYDQTLANETFDFLLACSMALNSSTVLFVGLSNASDSELKKFLYGTIYYDQYQWSYIKNDISASYNFDHNTWTKHESLNYPSQTISGIELDYGYEVLCSPYHGKNESKILAISFMIDKYEYFAQKYHPFAWTSSIDVISWNSLEIKNKNFNIPGRYQILNSSIQ